MYPSTENPTGSYPVLKLVTDLDLRIVSASEQVHAVSAVLQQQSGSVLLHQALPFFEASSISGIPEACLRQPSLSHKLDVCAKIEGQIRYFTWVVALVTDHQGKPEALHWAGVETTHSKRRTEQSLFQQKVLDNISDALVMMDAEMVVTAFNKRSEQLYGISALQVIGRKMTDFLSFQPAHETKTEALEKLTRTGQWNGVAKFQKASGELLYVSSSLTAVKNDCGSLLGYVAIDRDVTEQYRLQQNHQQQTTIKTLLQDIMDQTGALAWATDATGQKRYMNATYRQAFGIAENEKNLNIRTLFSGADLENILEHNRQVIEQGAVLDLIEEMPPPHFPGKIFRSLKFPVHTAEGTFAAGFALDVTQELEHEAELALLRQRFEKAAKIIADVIMDWDIEKDLLWRSDPEKGMEVHPTKAQSMQERYARMHPEDTSHFRQTLEAALNGGATRWECEYRYQSGKTPGRYKVLKERAAILRGEGGKAVRMISVVQDVTEQRQLKRELQAKERAVIAASIEGQEAERSELARELHDNVGQVLAMCKLFVEIAADTVPHEYLEKCKHHLQRAISEIRSLSHRLSPETLSRKGLPAAISDMLEGINQTGKLRVIFKKCTQFDTAQLPRNVQTTAYRIVQECISNILKHAQATEVFLRLCIQGSNLHIEMKDNGKGFDVNQARSGIGLKNINNRIELSGGKIELEAAPGKGCSILVHLPLGS